MSIASKAGTALASKVVAAATGRLGVLVLGTKQQRDVRKAYGEAFEALVAGVPDGDAEHLQTVLEQFVSDPQVADRLLAVALAGAELPADELVERFVALGYDPATLTFDFAALMQALARHLDVAALEIAALDADGLFARAALSRLEAVRERLDEGGRRLDRLTDGLLALPSVPHEGIERFLRDYLGGDGHNVPFGGRDDELAQLLAWARAGAGSYALVLAPAGGGKSSVLAHLAATLSADPTTDVVFVPVSVRYGTGLSQDSFGALVARLAHVHGRSTLEGVAGLWTSWRRVAAAMLAEPPPPGRRLVVLLDGLDEAVDWEPGRDMFPLDTPPGLRVIVSVRERPDDPDGRQWLDQLGWAAGRDAMTLRLASLAPDGTEAVVLAQPLPGLDDEQRRSIAAVLHELTGGDPVLLRLYVDDLIRTVAAGAVPDLETLAARPSGLEGYFERFFEDQRRIWLGQGVAPLGERTARSLLNLLSGAHGPILQRDVVDELARPEDELDSLALQAVLPALERFVVGDGRVSGYVLSHPRLAEFLRSRMTARERAAIEQRYLSWGRRVLDALGRDAETPVPPYLLAYLAVHLHASGRDLAERAEACAELMTDAWRRAAFARTQSYEGFLSDVDLAQRASEEAARAQIRAGVPALDLGQLVRYALIRSSIHSIADNVPPELLVGLVAAGLWSPEQGLVSARTMLDHASQAHALVELAPHLSAALAQEALHVAREISSTKWRARAVVALADRLPQPARDAVLRETVRGCIEESSAIERADALLVFAAKLPRSDRSAWQTALWEAIEAIDQWKYRGIALLNACPHLGRRRNATLRAWLAGPRPEDRPDSVPNTADFYDWLIWADLACAVRPHYDSIGSEAAERCAALLRDAIGAFEDDARGWYASAVILASLAVAASSIERPQALAAALEAGARISEPVWLARWCSQAVVSEVEGDEQAVPRALDAMPSGGGDENFRDEFLVRIAPWLEPPHAERAGELAMEIAGSSMRARALAVVAPRLPDEAARRSMLQQALDDASSLDDVSWAEDGMSLVAGAAAAIGDRRLAEEIVHSLEEQLFRGIARLGIALAEPAAELFAAALDELEDVDGWTRLAPLARLALAAPEPVAAEARMAILESIHEDPDAGVGHWIEALHPLLREAPEDFLEELVVALAPNEDGAGAIVLAAASQRLDGVPARDKAAAAAALARTSPHPRVVVDALTHAARYFTGTLRTQAVADAFELILPDDRGAFRGDALGELGALAEPQLLARFVDVALSAEEDERIAGLSLLIQYVEPSRAIELAAEVASVEAPLGRAILLDHVLLRLPREHGSRILTTHWGELAQELSPLRRLPCSADFDLRRLTLCGAVASRLGDAGLVVAFDHYLAMRRFVTVADGMPEAVAYDALAILLDTLAAGRRSDLFDAVGLLAPLLAKLGGAPALRLVSEAARDVEEWWP